MKILNNDLPRLLRQPPRSFWTLEVERERFNSTVCEQRLFCKDNVKP